MRNDLAIGVDTITDTELESLFKQVDVDGGGEVDAEECAPNPPSRQHKLALTKRCLGDCRFVAWLFEEVPKSKTRSKRAAAIARLKQKFKEASASACEDIGWDLVFEKYDDDGSGELEFGEFTTAVRLECGLSEAAVSSSDIEELFGVIDADGSGAIDAGELKLLLGADLDAPSMSFGAFYSSMFELASLWSEEESEEQYCLFLGGLFDWISLPTNGHELGEPGLETLSVFDGDNVIFPGGPRVANFKLKRLEDIGSMVGPGGNLLIDGFRSALGEAPGVGGGGPPPPERKSGEETGFGQGKPKKRPPSREKKGGFDREAIIRTVYALGSNAFMDSQELPHGVRDGLAATENW